MSKHRQELFISNTNLFSLAGSVLECYINLLYQNSVCSLKLIEYFTVYDINLLVYLLE